MLIHAVCESDRNQSVDEEQLHWNEEREADFHPPNWEMAAWQSGSVKFIGQCAKMPWYNIYQISSFSHKHALKLHTITN